MTSCMHADIPSARSVFEWTIADQITADAQGVRLVRLAAIRVLSPSTLACPKPAHPPPQRFPSRAGLASPVALSTLRPSTPHPSTQTLFTMLPLLPLLALAATAAQATPLYTPSTPPPSTFGVLGSGLAKAPLHSLAVDTTGVEPVQDGYSESIVTFLLRSLSEIAARMEVAEEDGVDEVDSDEIGWGRGPAGACRPLARMTSALRGRV